MDYSNCILYKSTGNFITEDYVNRLGTLLHFKNKNWRLEFILILLSKMQHSTLYNLRWGNNENFSPRLTLFQNPKHKKATHIKQSYKLNVWCLTSENIFCDKLFPSEIYLKYSISFHFFFTFCFFSARVSCSWNWL